MKLTKYVHACLLVETSSQTILVDPGQFSWESGLVSVDALSQLDAVVITHEHFDHFHPPFIAAVLKKFPGVTFVTTPSVAAKLHDMGAVRIFTDSIGSIAVFSKKHHASLEPLDKTPENIAVHIADKLTVGGDRQDLEETKEVLALTVTAPWGSMIAATGMAQRLKPKVIVPIHDWHWNDKARAAAYDKLEEFFAKHDIDFRKPADGQAIEV